MFPPRKKTEHVTTKGRGIQNDLTNDHPGGLKKIHHGLCSEAAGAPINPTRNSSAHVDAAQLPPRRGRRDRTATGPRRGHRNTAGTPGDPVPRTRDIPAPIPGVHTGIWAGTRAATRSVPWTRPHTQPSTRNLKEKPVIKHRQQITTSTLD